MNRRLALASAALAIALPLALSACGNKGPLVLPDKPADASVPEPPPPPDTVPAPEAAPPAR